MAEQSPLSIVHVVSEVAPYAKTGGLADVAAGLPAALAALGHDVTVVVPRYREIDCATREVGRCIVPLGAGSFEAGFGEFIVGPRHRIVLVDCPALYDRDGLYGVQGTDHPDNAVRFAFLARSALEFLDRVAGWPDVIHAHDWQAGLVPVYLAAGVVRPATSRPGTVFTIHNLAYQGRFANVLSRLGVPERFFRPDGLEFWGEVSFLKGGVTFSDLITTVSPRYSREILTAEYGFGFEGVLQGRVADLVGILNGIDDERWNPQTDPFLPAPYSAVTLGGKATAKRALLDAFGLSVVEPERVRPVVGMVSRLVDQKGFDLLAQLPDRLLALDATYVLLGSGERRYESFWQDLATRHPTRVAVRIGFDEALAHLIEGGSDIFLMPSRFEPCGLNQMYSLRYGTVPVVRATGGLADTVIDHAAADGTGNGFTFVSYEPAALEDALDRAIRTYRDAETWRRLQQAGMRQDHSWNASAREYVKVYRRAREAAGTRHAQGTGNRA